MAELDLDSFDAMLKEHYTNDEVARITLKDHPTLALLPKYTEMGGRHLPIPVIISNPKGRAKTFATAQSNAAPGGYKEFLLTSYDDFGVVKIARKALKAAEKDTDAFVAAKTAEIDGMMDGLMASCSKSVFGDGGGSCGRRGSISGTAVTLKNPDDISFWEPGMKVVASSANGLSGALRAGTAATIDSVDRSAGKLISSTWGNITGFADNDYLFPEGDWGSGGISMRGFEAWFPATAPTSGDNHFGVDRSIDPDRLAGSRFDGSTLTTQEALLKFVMRIARTTGGKIPSHIVINHLKEHDLAQSLGAKVVYDSLVSEFGFDALVLHTSKGKVRVYSDADCLSDRAYGFHTDYAKLYSIGPVPDLFDDDGVRMLRETSADGVEIRASYYASLGITNPAVGGVCRLSA